MQKNTQVRWVLKTGHTGTGITISDEEDGHIQVAVVSRDGVAPEVHHVIWCAVTWLKTVIPG